MQLQRADRTLRRLTAAASAAAVLIWTTRAHAANYTWVGGASGATTTWSNAGNWTPTGGPPGAADEAIFNTTTTNQPSLTANASIGELDFNASGWTIGGTSTLTINSISGIGILDAASSGTDTISDKISIAAAQTWDVGTSATLTISGAISGSSALTLGDTSGTYGGTVNLTAANTFTGALIVDSGTLEVGGSGSINTASSLTLSGGNLLINGAITVSTAINLGSDAAISATNGNIGTISGAVTGSNNLTFGAVSTNTGTVNLTNANTGYTGAVTVAYGTLGLTGSGSLNTASSITVNGGATLNYNQTATASVPIQDNGSLTVSGGALTFSGNGTIADNGSIATNATVDFGTSISGSGSITVNGGADTFTASNSFAGSMAINGGTVTVSGAGTLSSIGTITMDNGASLLINNTTAAGGNLNNRMNSGGTINSYGGTLVYTGSDATSSNGGIGSLDLFSGVITTVTVTANGNPASFELNSLQHSSGGGVLFVNGANLGSSTGAQIFVSQGTTVSGTSPGSPADKGSGSALNQQIVPFIVGESGMGAGAVGTATGTPNTFVTAYSTTDANASNVYGLRPLNPTDEFASSINNSTVGDNIYLTTSQSAALTSNNSINSLVINGSGGPALTIPDGVTLNDASGAVLFVTNGTIKPSSSTGTLDFGGNEGVVTADSGATGTISAPISGSNALAENGLGTLTLNTTSSSFTGSLYANDGTLQLGNGASASADGVLPNVSGYFINNGGTINIDDVNPQTITAPVTFLQASPGPNAAATLLISGPGAVTLNDTISFSNNAPSPSNTGNAYIESQTIAPVALTGTFNLNSGVSMWLYEGGTNQAGTPIGSNSSPVTWSLTNGGSIGTSGSPVTASLYLSNTNFATGATPSPVVFNLTNTGQIGLAGNMYVGYNGGAITANINGPINLTQVNGAAGALFGAYNPGNANNNSTDYNVINVGAGGSINVFAAYLAYSQGQFQYLGVTNGGQFSINNQTASSNAYTFFASNLGDGLVEVGTINGSPGAGSAINFGTQTNNTNPPAITFNGGTTSTGAHVANQFSVLNVFAGGSLNISSPAGGSGASGGTGGLNAGYAAGQTFVLNVYGGALNDFGGNEPVYVDAGIPNSAAGAGFTVYSIVNVDSDANGNVGKLITAYLRALPNPTNGSTSVNGSTGAFLNFNGGEVEYNNLAASGNAPGPGNGIPNNGWTGGVFVFSKGAILGTNALDLTGASPPTGASNVNHPLMAPLGDGVITIPISNGGTGYLNPPMVQITDTTGIDAAAVATLTNGVVTAITITSPGINYTSPTITLIGGDPTTAATIGTPTVAANANTGGFTKVDNGALIAQGGYWYPSPGQNPATMADLQAAQNTYGGPTTVVAGTLELNGVYNETNNVIIETNTSTDAATLQINQPTSLNGITSTTTPAWVQVNNNMPLAAAIVVGDVPANTVINGTTLTTPGTFQITATGKAGVSGFALNAGQVLAGFGTVTGTGTFGLNIGQAPSGAVAGAITSNALPNPATPTALTGTHSVISPGYTANSTALVLLNNQGEFQPNNGMYGAIVVGISGGGTPTVTFDTKAGNATSLSETYQTGALTLGNNTGMTTSLGGAGTYLWKLDLSNGGAGATPTPGSAVVSPGLSGGPAAGAFWDELILDGVTVNSTIGATASGTTNAFTVQGFSFSSGTTQSANGGSAISLSGNAMPAASYSWVIARVNQAYNPTTAASLLANLSLDTTGLPAPASGYQYFLNTQQDPSANNDTDLVISYAPTPEPTALLLVGLGAGTLMIRRRRT